MSEIENYKTDRLELARQQEEYCLKKFEEMITTIPNNNIKFLKENYNFKKIRDRKTEPHISTLVSIMWTRISLLSGLKTETHMEIAQDLTNMIFSAFNELSLEEIYKAFELERYSIYEAKTSHFQLFNSDYVSEILKKYKKWKENTKIQHNICVSDLKKNTLPELTQNAKKELLDNAIVRVFNEYKETKEIQDPCAHIFDELFERGFIKKITSSKIFNYYQEKRNLAEEMLRQEYKQELSFEANKTKRLQINEILNNLAEKQSSLIENRAKKLVLIDFFEKKISENIDLENLIKK